MYVRLHALQGPMHTLVRHKHLMVHADSVG